MTLLSSFQCERKVEPSYFPNGRFSAGGWHSSDKLEHATIPCRTPHTPFHCPEKKVYLVLAVHAAQQKTSRANLV
jgi:hypothetical protein